MYCGANSTKEIFFNRAGQSTLWIVTHCFQPKGSQSVARYAAKALRSEVRILVGFAHVEKINRHLASILADCGARSAKPAKDLGNFLFFS